MALRPGQDYVRVRVTARHRLFPLPHKFQHRHVVQLLKSWRWSAKPLQPSKGDSSGCAWEVGSSSEPPAPAMPLGEDFVLITKLRDQQGASVGPATVTASSRTKKRIIYDDNEPATGTDDPWAGGHDPWSSYLAPPGLPAPKVPVPPVSSTRDSKYDQLRQELASEVKTVVQQEVRSGSLAQASSGQEDRLQRLEVGFQELKLQGEKFEGWFQKFGQQVASSSQQIQGVACTVASQQKDLQHVRAEVSQQADIVQSSLHRSVAAMQSEVSSQLTAQLTSQFEKLEALLSKRPRTE